MPELPLLRLPNPSRAEVPDGGRNISNVRKPTKGRQRSRFGPVFDRLQTVLSRADDPIELRDDPTALAPERVIVFEIGGTVADFLKALGKVKGLEFMAEIDTDFAADEDFALQYGDAKRRGRDKPGRTVPGRLYLAMPDLQALRQLVSLWERWKNDQPLDRGLAPIANLFSQLHDLRPWGPQDRIPAETVEFWREEMARDPDRSIRAEVELWYRTSEARRQEASAAVRTAVTEAGGRVVHESLIEDIAYHGLLVDIPSAYVQRLIDLQAVRLALADEVMFLRPQSVLRDPQDIESAPDGSLDAVGPGSSLMIQTIWKAVRSCRSACMAQLWLRSSCMATATIPVQHCRARCTSAQSCSSMSKVSKRPTTTGSWSIRFIVQCCALRGPR